MSQEAQAKRQKTDHHEERSVVEFVYKGQSKINIPAGVSHVTTSPKIKEEYFLCCKPLRFLSIGKSVQSIDMSAFEGCTYLAKVELQEGLKTITRGAFRRCSSLVEIDLPKTLETIGRGVFEGCGSLKHVRCHKKEGLLKTIGDRALMNCSSLVNVAMPQELTYIGSEAFKNCTSLMSAVALPNKSRTIRSETFSGCINLLGIEIPATTDGFVIEQAAFAGCQNLTNIWIPPSAAASNDDDDDDVAANAFDGCEKMMIQQGENIVERLRDRYTNLPVHKACYNSSRTTVEELMEVLGAEKNNDNLEDCFGLTPFHVVAASANPRIGILQCLLDHYPVEVLKRTNRNGQQMMEYLLNHTSSDVAPLINIVTRKLGDG
mmetsp:Transcript_9516/g.22411  ORF Transcript_9516/g.22411 Transcript_9516/m.22411 type:complete len:376 (+) Transcript_9516:118-1245(+)